MNQNVKLETRSTGDDGGRDVSTLRHIVPLVSIHRHKVDGWGGKNKKVRPEGYEKWTSHKKKELGETRKKVFKYR
jgi:hypothetical protein